MSLDSFPTTVVGETKQFSVSLFPALIGTWLSASWGAPCVKFIIRRNRAIPTGLITSVRIFAECIMGCKRAAELQVVECVQ